MKREQLPIDSELSAIRKVEAALRGLSQEERRRVVRYVEERFIERRMMRADEGMGE